MHELWLSIGKHRRETNWKNKKFTWQELLQKLSTTQRTGETVKEYAALDKDQQDQIKDIGGFVGGIITGGRRKKTAISSRSLITLDIDQGTPDFYDQLTLLYGCALCVYSTHKHTPDNPRLRLIIPLSEEVLPDQYQAIARKIAEAVGMELFDPTTFQPERLMYWPSTPKDGVYLFEQQNGAFLDPAKVLAKYKDWTDSSQWPMHPSEMQHVHEGVQVAQDPTEKTGVVGAFCRVYGIAEVIETYLQDVYEPAQEGRYSYKHGSTAGGLVVYGDKWAYSHHGTDPVSGHLCNAFDLVRLHKYGRLDNRVNGETPINRHPSFIAMAEFAQKDSAVNLDLVKQRTGNAMQAFAEVRESGEADEWLKLLELDSRDKIVATAQNLLIIFRNDPNLKGKLGFNSFQSRPVIRGSVPWNDQEGDRYWEDEDDAGIRWYIETSFGFTAISKIEDCVKLIRRENSFHPVREYLQAQIWDGKPRIEGILTYYLGVEDNEYARAVIRKMMVAAVARVMEPGIKFDTGIVLIGPQGSAKSSFVRILGQPWYSESLGKLSQGNKAEESLKGAWLMEIPELSAFKNAEVEEIKHFMAKTKDDYRPAWGHNITEFLRQVTFWLTSNRYDFNRDQSGGRRFWPVVVQKSRILKARVYKELEQQRSQLWAEAVYYWSNGEDLILSAGLEDFAEQVQAEHTERDPWEQIIREMLQKPIPENWEQMSFYDRRAFLRGDETQPLGIVTREYITPKEIYFEFLDGKIENFSIATGRRIAAVMRKIEGWEFKIKRFGVEIKRTYCRLVTGENKVDTDDL